MPEKEIDEVFRRLSNRLQGILEEIDLGVELKPLEDHQGSNENVLEYQSDVSFEIKASIGPILTKLLIEMLIMEIEIMDLERFNKAAVHEIQQTGYLRRKLQI
ncbi:MAG: hypothetical protein H6966_00585 [Chromatiaceae bacterium]|nr:hypothetical protein [Chromatiaceae bacterium]